MSGGEYSIVSRLVRFQLALWTSTNSGGLAVNLDFQLIAAVSEGPIPEPATGVLLAGGALLLYWRRRRV